MNHMVSFFAEKKFFLHEMDKSLGCFNPFVWLLRSHLLTVHKFETDREVMKSRYQVDLTEKEHNEGVIF